MLITKTCFCLHSSSCRFLVCSFVYLFVCRLSDLSNSRTVWHQARLTNVAAKLERSFVSRFIDFYTKYESLVLPTHWKQNTDGID